MKKIFTLLVMVCLGMTVFAQNKIGKISGRVVDDKQISMEAATVTLLRNKDKTLAKVGDRLKLVALSSVSSPITTFPSTSSTIWL